MAKQADETKIENESGRNQYGGQISVKDMFYHAFDGYMQHAFPLDELRPLSCQGEDSLGGYALTLIDSLDTLALLGDKERFAAGVEWVGKNVRFDINKTVSVFETNIRILGGLLSAHLIASDYATITSTAGGGTLTLEFGVLSRLTNNTVFEQVAKNSVRGIWARRSKLNLVGAHINVFTGEWTQKDAGIGTSIDSFYEYVLKAYLLFGDEEYLYVFQEAYKAAMHYLHHDPWYIEVNMNSGATVWPLFNSLQAFWPGLQVLAGDVDPAIRTHAAFFSVWKKYGFTPEGFNLATSTVQNGQRSYPLRPELIESTYWLFKATRDYRYLDVGRDILASLQYAAKCPCGYCHISDVETHKQDDHMESFFLAETAIKSNYEHIAAVGPDNIVENGPYKYIFSTEGHLLPATPEITLVDEHCLHFGDRGYGSGDGSSIQQSANCAQFDERRTVSSQNSLSNVLFTTRGYIKGVCPGLSHAQKLGISYHGEEDNTQNSRSHEHPDESYVDQSSVQIQSSSVILISHPATSPPDEPLKTRSRAQHLENIVVTGDSEPIEVTDATGGSSEGNTEIFSEVTLSISEQIEVTAEEIVTQDNHIEDSTS
ncbi:putative alpha-mannosidase I MNS4 [Triticum urartu]|uniref:alpha-1,2-Mannosidase n=1 Tax=Triticum urartu TaxID=4572 RepID=M7YLM1_TRIUA|nr:putative alpha-mannosidase I MNS4 [Triticum urartu]